MKLVPQTFCCTRDVAVAEVTRVVVVDEVVTVVTVTVSVSLRVWTVIWVAVVVVGLVKVVVVEDVLVMVVVSVDVAVAVKVLGVAMHEQPVERTDFNAGLTDFVKAANADDATLARASFENP